MSGFISSFKQKGKDLCLALSQVPASFTVVIRESGQQASSKSDAGGWLFLVICFSEHKMVRDFQRQRLGKISQPSLFTRSTRLI